MQIARVISPVSLRESWTVLGDDDAPVAPVDRYLAYLTDIERSPNTVKAYAHDLKDWFGLSRRAWSGLAGVRLDDVGEFVAWLRLPLQARDGRRCGVAVGAASLHGIDGEPQTFGALERSTPTLHEMGSMSALC